VTHFYNARVKIQAKKVKVSRIRERRLGSGCLQLLSSAIVMAVQDQQLGASLTASSAFTFHCCLNSSDSFTDCNRTEIQVEKS